jgi:glycosyl transferase family 25
MSKYLDFFDGVYYINLPERTDRKELFESRSAALGMNAIHFEGVKPEPEYVKMMYDGQIDPTRSQKIGCTLSHQAIVREAKEKSLKNVLIFEDDCLFLDGFTDKLIASIDELEGLDWDLFYLGGEPNNYMHQVSEHLYMMKNDGGIYATHAYAVNSSFYDKFLNVEANTVSVIDIYLLNMQSDVRKLYATSEILAVQDATYSDIWHYMTDSQQLMIDGWNKYIKNGIKL